ncbi:hypothetical protein DW186_21385 [Odoribacter sp. AM16-33]|nr:hypothetical protein DW186_21385 [Odoribacter sp. AM16-33]
MTDFQKKLYIKGSVKMIKFHNIRPERTKMKDLKELEELQKVAVEITRLCSEYSQRAETETHEDLEPLWNQIQELKNQLKEGAQ